MSEENSESCEVGSEEYYGKALSKNVDYYVEAFKRFDETRKLTWNWAAFCLGSIWLFYRKMYFCGFIIWLMEVFISQFITENNVFFPILLLLGLRLLLGNFGNTWYYDVVKARINRGYHLVEKYRPTSLASGILTFLTGFGGLIVGFIDWLSVNKQLKTGGEYGVNEETIRAYLNSARSICRTPR